MKIPKRENLPRFSIARPNKFQALFIAFMIYILLAFMLPGDTGLWMLVAIMVTALIGTLLVCLIALYSLLGEL